MYQVQALPAFNDNYIWVLLEGSRCAVIDPGDPAPVSAFLEQHGLTLEAVLVTHHHADHTGGVIKLHEQHQAPVFGPAGSPFQGVTRPLTDGDCIEVLGQPLEIKAVPGHTLDHIAYLTPDQQQLFCGDTLFLAGCGRLFEGSASQMLSAMAYFRELPDDCQVYCAHEYSLANLRFAQAVEPGNAAVEDVRRHCQRLRDQGAATLPSTIGQERAVNPFMRYDQPTVKQAASQHAGEPLSSDVEVFQAVRTWKDHF